MARVNGRERCTARVKSDYLLFGHISFGIEIVLKTTLPARNIAVRLRQLLLFWPGAVFSRKLSLRQGLYSSYWLAPPYRPFPALTSYRVIKGHIVISKVFPLRKKVSLPFLLVLPLLVNQSP